MFVNKSWRPLILAILVLFLSSECSNSLVAAGDNAQLTVETIHNAWRNRASKIRTFEFSWTEKITVSRGSFSKFVPSQFKSRDHFEPAEDSTYDTTYRLVVDGGRIRAEGNKLLATPKEAALQDETWILKEGLGKSFRPKGPASPYPQGGISDGEFLKSRVDPHLLPVSLVLRPFRYTGHLFDNFTARYSIVPGQQDVRGRPCTVIKEAAQRAGQPYNVLWLDNERDFIPVRFCLQTAEKQLIQFEYLRWVHADNGWLPTEWRRTYLNPDPDNTVNYSALAVVQKQAINTAIDAKEFTLEFPAGTWVSDSSDPKNRREYILRDTGREREITRSELTSGATYEQFLKTDSGKAIAYSADPGVWWRRRSLWIWGCMGVCLLLTAWRLSRKLWLGQQHG